MNDSNTNPPPTSGDDDQVLRNSASSSEPESEDQSFLSWGASRKSKEYTRAISEIPNPNCTQQIVQQSTYTMPATLNYVQQQSQQSQSQQQLQTQEFDGLGRGRPPVTAYTRHNSRGTSQERSTSSSEAQSSPTPFRPMQPKEFSLGNNLRRPYSMMPLPNLPADVGSTSGSGSFEGGRVGGSGSVGSGGIKSGVLGSMLSSSGWRPKKKKDKSSSSAGGTTNANALVSGSSDEEILAQDTTTTNPTQQTQTTLADQTTMSTQLGLYPPNRRTSLLPDQESML